MGTYVYKRVDTKEVDLLNQLRQVFARAFGEESMCNSSQPSEEYLANVLTNTHYIALVASDENGAVVGGLVAFVLPKIDQERSEIYLYDLAVEEHHRQQGIATNLISALKGVAKRYGAYVIFVQADNEDTEAVALYTRLSKRVETEISHFDIAVE